MCQFFNSPGLFQCAIPENIHDHLPPPHPTPTHPVEGHWKFQGDGEESMK